MKVSEQLAVIFLGIWLIVGGITNLLHRGIPVLSEILPLLALVTGILLLISGASLKKNLGLILLAVWLIMKGLWPYIPYEVSVYGTVLHLLAVVSGVLILVRK